MSPDEFIIEPNTSANESRLTTNKPRVSVVVVTYNSSAVISECLNPISHSDLIEVIIVDNASADLTLEVVRQTAPLARIVQNRHNAGFASAVNVGLSKATGEYFLLLNPDAVLQPESILKMADRMDTNTKIGALAPLLDHPSGRLSIREGGRAPTTWRVFTHYSGLSRLASRWRCLEGLYFLDKDVHNADIETDWISGAALMTSAATWCQMGGLSERWFMYAEDIELCLRIRDSGRKVVISPSIPGLHGLGQSTGGAPSANPAWVVNMFDLYKTKISSSRFENLLWKLVMCGGLSSRSAGFKIRSIQDRSKRSEWATESSRFRKFALAIANERLTANGR